VRGRVDWKYCLGLELDDEGFDFTVLSGFRARLRRPCGAPSMSHMGTSTPISRPSARYVRARVNVAEHCSHRLSSSASQAAQFRGGSR
jgi:hypothetical protein